MLPATASGLPLEWLRFDTSPGSVVEELRDAGISVALLVIGVKDPAGSPELEPVAEAFVDGFRLAAVSARRRPAYSRSLVR